MNVYFKCKDKKLKQIDVDTDNSEEAIKEVSEWIKLNLPLQVEGAVMAVVK